MTTPANTFPVCWLLLFVQRLAPDLVYAPLTAPGCWGDTMGIDARLRLLAWLLVALLVIAAWHRWPPPRGSQTFYGK